MGATVDTFKSTHQTATGLLEQIGSASGQQRIDTLNSLKEALLSHIGEENSVIKEVMDKPETDGSFKSSAQNFLDELLHLTSTFTDQSNHYHICSGGLGHHPQQYTLAHTTTRKEANTLPFAYGE